MPNAKKRLFQKQRPLRVIIGSVLLEANALCVSQAVMELKSIQLAHSRCKLLRPMKRRDFLFAAAVAAAPQSYFDFSLLPNFCSHEHWGSIDSIGTFPGGYRADIEPGAVPRRRTGFMDLLLDPYFRGWLRNGGADLTRIQPSSERGGKPSIGFASRLRINDSRESISAPAAVSCSSTGLISTS
jgi:hypothetical protein